MSAGPEDIPATYARQAEAWDRGRGRGLIEAGWLARAVEGLAAGATVLDLGCGAGEPIAAHLIRQGFALTGVDVAAPMLALCRARFPEGDWVEADMRGLSLGRQFDAVIAWNSFFHLAPEAQRAMFPVFAAHLRPGGRLLFTAGPAAGEVIGRVGTEAVYHASLDPSDYAARIEAAGMEVRAFIAEDASAGRHSVWLARRR